MNIECDAMTGCPFCGGRMVVEHFDCQVPASGPVLTTVKMRCATSRCAAEFSGAASTLGVPSMVARCLKAVDAHREERFRQSLGSHQFTD